MFASGVLINTGNNLSPRARSMSNTHSKLRKCTLLLIQLNLWLPSWCLVQCEEGNGFSRLREWKCEGISCSDCLVAEQMILIKCTQLSSTLPSPKLNIWKYLSNDWRQKWIHRFHAQQCNNNNNKLSPSVDGWQKYSLFPFAANGEWRSFLPLLIPGMWNDKGGFLLPRCRQISKRKSACSPWEKIMHNFQARRVWEQGTQAQGWKTRFEWNNKRGGDGGDSLRENLWK